MSELGLSTRTKSLLASARGDAPSSAAKAKIWSAVALQAGPGGPGGSSSGSAAGSPGGSAATATSAKMLAMGTLLGSAVTVGLALVLMRIAPSAPPPAHHPSVSLSPSPSPSTSPSPSPSTASPTPSPALDTTAYRERAASPPRPRALAHPAAVTVAEDDPLMQEASFVAEARAALARGDAGGAIRSIQAARGTGSHQLLPEETSLEAQARRALAR